MDTHTLGTALTFLRGFLPLSGKDRMGGEQSRGVGVPPVLTFPRKGRRDPLRKEDTVRRRRFSTVHVALLAGLVAQLTVAAVSWAQDPFIDTIASFAPGTGAGFGADQLPDIVLGPPLGAGDLQGSYDVVSLGNSGSIVVGFDTPVICDGPGADFTVFENAFHSGSASGPIFAEYGIVAVSQDGVTFFELPYDALTHSGLAGQTPVYSHPDNDIDPLDPAVSGGDTFDLAAVGLAWAAFVRITDPGAAIPDPGNMIPPGTSGGFDLDAIAALHACDPGEMPTPTSTASAPPHTASPTPTVTPVLPPSTHDASVGARRPIRVRIRPGETSASKRFRVKVRNADPSGSVPIRLTLTGCGPVVGATIDFDRRSAGAQDSIEVRAGAAKSALVTLEVAAALVDTPDRRVPEICQLGLHADADVANNNDPTPSDNSAVVDLSVLDKNDVE